MRRDLAHCFLIWFWGEIDTCRASIILAAMRGGLKHLFLSDFLSESPKIVVSRSAVAKNIGLTAEAIAVYGIKN
jgi:hypothetical protein